MDRHGLTDIGGPLFVGGVSFLTPATGLFTDSRMLRHLRTEQSFRDYLEFREEAFKLAAEEMVAACDSPVCTGSLYFFFHQIFYTLSDIFRYWCSLSFVCAA
jgi:hypothetical protein